MACPDEAWNFLERRDDTWWVIDPGGRGFFAIGTDHVNFNVHWCERLGYAPYNRNCVERYGTEERWAEEAVSKLSSWNFNLLGANNSPSTRYRGLAHTLFLSFGSEFASYDDIVPKVHWTGFPDVFSPDFERHCDLKAREICRESKDDPWLFGYFLDNELEWYGKIGRPWGIFTETVKKPGEHRAKRALVDFLRKRYPGIEELNRAWDTSFASFDGMLERTDWAEPSNNAWKRDALDFVGLVAEKYFSITTSAVRKYDPNHLILGSRFAGDVPEPVWKAAGRYCDVVSLNFYDRVDLDSGEPIGLVKHLERVHGLCRRPLMVTEWSFPALDSGLPCKHGAGMRVDTQSQKARCFKIYQTTFLSLPFVIGSDYFMWVDEPALGRFYPLLWQEMGGKYSWPAPDRTEHVRISLGSLRVVLSAVLVSDGGSDGFPYRTLWRAAIYPGRRWIAVRAFWIGSVAEEEWSLRGYLAFARPAIGGDTRGDVVGGPDVPNYYLNFGEWYDPGFEAHYGVAARSGGFRIRYWVSEGGYHADAVRGFDAALTLRKGETFRSTREPEAFAFGALGPDREKPWSKVISDALSSPTVHVFQPERP